MSDARTNIRDIPKIKKEICCIKETLNSVLTNTNEGISEIVDLNFNSVSNQLAIQYKLSNGSIQIKNTTISSDFKPKIVVNTYSDLASVTGQELFEFAEVRNSEGNRWLPGSVGGTYYGAGLYYWNGTEWKGDNDKVYEALQNLINSLATKSNIGHTHTKSEITDFNESDYAKSVDLDNHKNNLNNPHQVQSTQIPNGMDYVLLYENSLI